MHGGRRIISCRSLLWSAIPSKLYRIFFSGIVSRFHTFRQDQNFRPAWIFGLAFPLVAGILCTAWWWQWAYTWDIKYSSIVMIWMLSFSLDICRKCDKKRVVGPVAFLTCSQILPLTKAKKMFSSCSNGYQNLVEVSSVWCEQLRSILVFGNTCHCRTSAASQCMIKIVCGQSSKLGEWSSSLSTDSPRSWRCQSH